MLSNEQDSSALGIFSRLKFISLAVHFVYDSELPLLTISNGHKVGSTLKVPRKVGGMPEVRPQSYKSSQSLNEDSHSNTHPRSPKHLK